MPVAEVHGRFGTSHYTVYRGVEGRLFCITFILLLFLKHTCLSYGLFYDTSYHSLCNVLTSGL